MTKILIVEDHADIRRLIRMTLEFDNHEIREAVDGESAMLVAQEFEPDLLLLDVMMPGKLNGLDVCRLLKLKPKAPSIVLLSARGRSEDLEAGMQVGADAYLVKPFSPLELIETVKPQWGAA